MSVFISDEEIQILIEEGLKDAEQELMDNGKELTIDCDYKNGDTKDTSSYASRIDNVAYNKEDMARHNRLKRITGLL